MVSNLPSIHCFLSVISSNSCFSKLICKGVMHTFLSICIIFLVCSSFCLQKEWVNPIYKMIICPSNTIKIICREGCKISRRAFHLVFLSSTEEISTVIAVIEMSPNSFLLANLCLYFNFFWKNVMQLSKHIFFNKSQMIHIVGLKIGEVQT